MADRLADGAVTQLCALFNEVLDDDEAVSAIQIMQANRDLALRALGGEVAGTLHACRSDVPGGDCGCQPMWSFPKGQG